MKKLLVLVLVLAAGYTAYKKFVAAPPSEEMKQVATLAEDFSLIKQQMTQAGRSAGATGLDMTSDVDSSLAAAETLLKKVQELKEGLAEDKALQRAEELEAQIQAFLKRE